MVAIFLGFLVSFAASAGDICQTKYTITHYAQSECVNVERPVGDSSGASFQIRSVLITKDLAQVDQKPTVVVVPGGPGNSGEALMIDLQKREIINSMWYSMGVNIVVYDPRGTGMSVMPQDITKYGLDVLSLDNAVEDLKAVIQKTARNKPVILMAHSAGGQTVMRFTEKYPELAQKIVLISASVSARQMARLTLGLQAKDSYHWNELVKTVADPKRRDELKAKYARVEDVLIQQLKARILKKHVHPNLKPISPERFRQILLNKIQEDATGAKFFEFMENYYRIFAEMDVEGPLLVPQELRELKIQPSDLTTITYHATDWMIRLTVCGLGLTESEINTPILQDGITMQRYCEGLHFSGQAFYEPALESIDTPVLYFSGLMDTQVPTSVAQKEIVDRLPNVKMVVDAEAGHTFYQVKPAIFYDEVKAFIFE